MRRKKKGEEANAGPGWEIVYTGFVLILLCFFIMLCSFSSMVDTKVMQFVSSFVNTLSIFSGGMDFEQSKVVLPDSPDIVDVESGIGQIFQQIEKLMKDLGVEGDIDLVFSEEGLVMRLSDNVLFNPGEAGVSPDAIPLLMKIGSIIQKTPYEIRIEGHTDNVPINTERFPSNWYLSTARAVNVLRFFLKNEDISPQRLSAVGFGEFQPVFPNDSAEHRAKNRRVEIVFVRSEDISSAGEEQGWQEKN
ncbi:MAG: flagellar motor protein MotB [Deltaproteobacteria bacterium]|nr:flagellar motor protein MotB [Deltaproteobacteria bacterium]